MKSNSRKKKRQTLKVLTPQQRKKRKKQDGRPPGTNKIFPFEQTRLGFMIKYEAPVVYGLLFKLLPKSQHREPPVEVIKTLCSASKDPSFSKPKFSRYLEQYEREGVCCKRGKKLTPERMVFYHRLRQQKLSSYLRQFEELKE